MPGLKLDKQGRAPTTNKGTSILGKDEEGSGPDCSFGLGRSGGTYLKEAWAVGGLQT